MISIWCFLHNLIPWNVNLSNRGIKVAPRCFRCGDVKENTSHGSVLVPENISVGRGFLGGITLNFFGIFPLIVFFFWEMFNRLEKEDFEAFCIEA